MVGIKRGLKGALSTKYAKGETNKGAHMNTSSTCVQHSLLAEIPARACTQLHVLHTPGTLT